MNMLPIVDAYLASRRALGVRLERAGRWLYQFVRETGDVPLADIKPELVERFLRGHGALSATWTSKYLALAGLYRFAIARGYVDASPLPAYPPKLPPPPPPYVYSTNELQRLVDASAVLYDGRSKLQALTAPALVWHGDARERGAWARAQRRRPARAAHHRAQYQVLQDSAGARGSTLDGRVGRLP